MIRDADAAVLMLRVLARRAPQHGLARCEWRAVEARRARRAVRGVPRGVPRPREPIRAVLPALLPAVRRAALVRSRVVPPVAVALAARGVATVRAPRVVGRTLAVVPELRVALADGPVERTFAPGVADVVRGRVVRAHDFRGRRPVDEDDVLRRHGRRARRRRGRRVGREAAVPMPARPAAVAFVAAHERVPVRAPR